jgi:hypothetical protein
LIAARRTLEFQHPASPSRHTNHVLLLAISHRSSADGCKCCALLLSIPVAGDASAFSVALAFAGRPRLARPETMEKTMRVLTLNELMRLSKIELCDLAARITNNLPEFPEGSAERANAGVNLRNIRARLARRDFTP